MSKTNKEQQLLAEHRRLQATPYSTPGRNTRLWEVQDLLATFGWQNQRGTLVKQ